MAQVLKFLLTTLSVRANWLGMDALIAIRDRRRQIAEQVARLGAEDKELIVAESVLARLGSDIDAGDKTVGSKIVGPGNASGGSKIQAGVSQGQLPRSQRELVIEALSSSHSAWLLTREIVVAVRDRWAVEIPEKSLRPLLSALKNSRRIVREGRMVALSARAREARPRSVGGEPPRAKKQEKTSATW